MHNKNHFDKFELAEINLGDKLEVKEDEVIEGVEEKSLRKIIEEVAEEEGLTVEQVEEAYEILKKRFLSNQATKPKRVKAKAKAKRKQAKKSRKKNRK